MKSSSAVLPLLVASLSCVGVAADRYVSSDGVYGSDISDAICYTDLQTAVTDAQDDETVWVTNGFVCASGIGGNKANKARIDVPNRRITIRSQAGLVDEAKGLGATIKGPGTACADADQARCVCFNGTTAKVIGFILEDGYPNANGGAVAGKASLLKNCVIRNSRGKRGGGIESANCEGCVITNNYATEMGGGVYYSKTLDSCTIAYNTCAQYGGGVGTWSPQANTLITNCWIYGNGSNQQGGGLAFRGSVGPVHIIHCVISNNSCIGSGYRTGGGCYTGDRAAKLFDCDIVDNVVTNGSAGGLYGCVATNCRIVRNRLLSTGGTYTIAAGCHGCILTNCVVAFNTNDCTAAGKMYSCGGGAYGGSFDNCHFEGNFANYSGGAVYGDKDGVPALEHCLVTNNISEIGRGGGVCGAERVVKSVIVDNVATNNAGTFYGVGGGLSECARVESCVIVGNCSINGGGVGKCTVVTNCWIAGNSAKSGGGANGGMLVNCVLTNNASSYRGGGFYGSTLYSCRVVGNRITAGECGGGWDGTCYNCLIANNQSVGFKCWDMVSGLFNCTVTGNGSSGFTTSGADKLRAVNVISWGNGAADKATLISSNCCLRSGYTVPKGSFNVFSADPRLTPDESGNLLPKSPKCRNVRGSELDWMSDSGDVRSKDLAGHDRIQGPAPELGCFEAPYLGLGILIR